MDHSIWCFRQLRFVSHDPMDTFISKDLNPITEAAIVIALVATTFGIVSETPRSWDLPFIRVSRCIHTWEHSLTKQGTRYAFPKVNRTRVVYEFIDTAMLSGIVHSRRVNTAFQVHINISLISRRRIFELALALDALRLRNIIQLIGLIGRWS